MTSKIRLISLSWRAIARSCRTQARSGTPSSASIMPTPCSANSGCRAQLTAAQAAGLTSRACAVAFTFNDGAQSECEIASTVRREALGIKLVQDSERRKFPLRWVEVDCGPAARSSGVDESAEPRSNFFRRRFVLHPVTSGLPPNSDMSLHRAKCREGPHSRADIRAATRLTICGSRSALDRFTRWVTSLMI